jgi:uncharacterized protein (DUF2147 family)
MEAWMKGVPFGSVALLLAALVMAPSPAFAADPTGTWLSQDGDSKIRITRCGEAICGNLAWLKQPNDASGRPKLDANNADAGKRNRPVLGVPIILGMRPDGADKWSGQVYNAEDGKTYSGSFTLAGANKAEIKGCVAIICKTKIWTRSN